MSCEDQISVSASSPDSFTDDRDGFGNRYDMVPSQSARSFSGNVNIHDTGGYLSLFHLSVFRVNNRQSALPISVEVVLSNLSAPAPVPEPATWAMAVAGLALLLPARPRSTARG